MVSSDERKYWHALLSFFSGREHNREMERGAYVGKGSGMQ